ncbi:MAG: proton-conducting transporter membrane subunit [Saprospiraceae bacterium]
MSELLHYLVLIPLAGFFASVCLPRKMEKAIYWTSITTVGLQSAVFLWLLFHWFKSGFADLQTEGLVLYHTETSHFTIGFFFDRNSAAYFAVSAILAFLVFTFSRYYIHRDGGFKRFFNNLLFFHTGLSFILFSGNLVTLFIGWEFIGITSFFLVAYYRERYLPVKNALKVVSYYRVADVFLLLGIWLSHHYFGHNVLFAELKELHRLGQPIITEAVYQWAIPLIFLVVAMVKSAQLPFSAWLPRAMEGPTSSSAIFYGSLSVHIGVFLLLRTAPLWESNVGFTVLVGLVGLATSVVASLTARVQSNIKTQIAYSSIAQIGIIFIELALGLHVLALVHFAGNAFLRTYQLLMSPSVLNYLIHDQFFNFIQPQQSSSKTILDRLRLTAYTMSIREWNLDALAYRYLWKPLKFLGNGLGFINARSAVWLCLPLLIMGLYFVKQRDQIPAELLSWLPVGFVVVGVSLILKAFVERQSAQRAWFYVVTSQLFVTMAIAFNKQFDFAQIYLYLSGILFSTAIGYWSLWQLRRRGESITLDRHHGHSYEYPQLTIVFMIATLGMSGFPITPAFIGEDIILGNVDEDQYSLMTLIAFSMILDGLAVLRIYARLFLGPHTKGYHEVAYRST